MDELRKEHNMGDMIMFMIAVVICLLFLAGCYIYLIEWQKLLRKRMDKLKDRITALEETTKAREGDKHENHT